MELVAHFGIDGTHEVEEQGMEVFARGESRWNWRFGQKVEDEAMGHGKQGADQKEMDGHAIALDL
jgi:hypothetical protein